ncbi:hypothetical protein [Ammoniphilus sp. CFH 90114]|uniref:hypothetical protein n=1 Tax=Ammoniphilus sp. CFH 90114 TaxID=2493665 RepID=UPI00100EB814|nr:hypothetical protein [Ammoniphilus sp. CFH 90114]RXT08855.1 hypothetical protein EIZ39_08625 [Ammoniphilus sp. CFH 90114]
MTYYNKITIDGEVFYRDSRCSSTDDLLTEEELIEQLLEEVVAEEIDIDEYSVRQAIKRVVNQQDRQMIDDYFQYLLYKK